MKKVLSWFFLLLIKIYQYGISPMMVSNCRFYPTCSSYTKQAIEQHGPFFGVYLGVKRILKCHPYHEGGVDLVPATQKEKDTSIK
ncbi:membrane protein insertion efficiency factor YidD [Gammaproteobacteria bacterium AS21]